MPLVRPTKKTTLPETGIRTLSKTSKVTSLPSGTKVDVPATSAQDVNTIYASEKPAQDVNTIYASEAKQPEIQDLPSQTNPANKESQVQFAYPTQTVTTMPSSDRVTTVYAKTQAPVSVLATSIPESTSPSAIVTKTPSTSRVALPSTSTVSPSAELPMLPGPESSNITPLPLPITQITEPEQGGASFDYKSAGLIALAAVVVIGGLVMWSSSSKGKTQAIAR
jgi:hypothetical protein